MKAWKYLILVGGIIGIAGFFLPLFTFHTSDGSLTTAISSYRIASGIEDVSKLIEGAAPATVATTEVRTFVETANRAVVRYRGLAVALYVPAVLLALVGAFAVARREMGRRPGSLGLALGVINAGLWLLVWSVLAQYPDRTIAMGIGLHALLAAGLLASFGGAGTLFSPDRGLYFD